MKRGLLIGVGTVGALGAVFAITPPEFGSSTNFRASCPSWQGAFDAGCTVGMVEVDQEGSSRDDRDSGPITADARAIDQAPAGV